MTALAPDRVRTVYPPEGTSPTVSRPRALVCMADMGRERLAEIEGEVLELETRLRVLLTEKATIEATIRVSGA